MPLYLLNFKIPLVKNNTKEQILHSEPETHSDFQQTIIL